MKSEYDRDAEGRFEDYLRQFRPSWSAEELRPPLREARAQKKRRLIRPVVWAGAAAAILLLCFGLPRWLSHKETTTERVEIAVPTRAVTTRVMRLDQQVRYGTLLAAACQGEGALEQLLDEVSHLILTPVEEEDSARLSARLRSL